MSKAPSLKIITLEELIKAPDSKHVALLIGNGFPANR